MAISVRDMEKTLLRKLGFSSSQGRHHFYDLLDGDGKIVAKTMLSHGPRGKDISKGIFSSIARQIKLTTPQLRDAVSCPLSRKDYSDILKEKSLIRSDLP